MRKASLKNSVTNLHKNNGNTEKYYVKQLRNHIKQQKSGKKCKKAAKKVYIRWKMWYNIIWKRQK